MRALVAGLVLPLCALPSCGESESDRSAKTPSKAVRQQAAGSAHRVAAAQCVACHEAEQPAHQLLAPQPTPQLTGIGAHIAPGWMESFLEDHYGGEDRAALTALLQQPGYNPRPTHSVDASAISNGERLWQQLGCIACHRQPGIPDLATKTDLTNLQAALLHADRRGSAAAWGGNHAFALGEGEARALATFLLREQTVATTARADAWAWECFHTPIKNGKQPPLEGLTPAAKGLTSTIDISHAGERNTNFALRFRGALEIPQGGPWEFALGADDGAWLWIDDELVIENGGIKPFKRVTSTVSLDAGWHNVQVVYTQGGGGARLELLWRTSGGAKLEPIPGSRMNATTTTLQSPAGAGNFDAATVERGRAAYTARRCNACHQTPDLPAPDSAPAWSALPAEGNCSVSPHPEPEAIQAARTFNWTGDPTAKETLHGMMVADGCTMCHERPMGEGYPGGGLRTEAANLLVEQEDLGEEGRVPPALTEVGHHLRRDWIAGVLTGDKRVRPYMGVRMPHLPAARAEAYADLFAAVDQREATAASADVEPPFSEEAAERGRELAGSSALSCITCHTAAGQPALGAQGMDLSVQHERLRPAWFEEWILAPNKARPGTRMPTFWPQVNEEARADAQALRVWMSLGAALPLPPGIRRDGEGLMLASDGTRPVLHGAFFDGLSARGLAVGTPQRAHYAYDLAHRRLAWLWKGSFLDGAGTWDGRAGKLIRPADQSAWVTLPQHPVFAVADTSSPIRLLGWNVDDDGYPTFRVQLGDVEITDTMRPKLTAQGAVMVRTLTAVGGTASATVAETGTAYTATIDGQPATTATLKDGQAVEVIYQW